MGHSTIGTHYTASMPVARLLLGHRLRRRSARARRVFWGAVIGYSVAGLLAVVWGMIPPEAWESGETARGFVGFWAMLVFPVIGAAVAGFVKSALTQRSR